MRLHPLIVLSALSACADDTVKTGSDAELTLAKEIGTSVCSNEVRFEDAEGKVVTSVTYHGLGELPIGGVIGTFQAEGSSTVVETNGGAFTTLDTAFNADFDWDFSAPELTCNTESCGVGWFGIRVLPSNEQVNGRTTGEWCGELSPVSIDVQFAEVDSEETSAASTCYAGSGRFQLLPLEMVDLNNNGSGRVTYLPAQVSGTGRLTNDALVTGITLVDDAGYPLRVIKPSVQTSFTATDLIANPNSTIAITGAHSFQVAPLRGMPKFFHPPMPVNTLIDAQVDISWGCGTADRTVTAAQGYVSTTSALGCPGIQRLTMRPSTGKIRWELYGNTSYGIETPTAPDGSFTLSRNGLTVTGKLLSYGSNGASVQLTSATLYGVPQCTAGTYTFAPEN